MFGKSATWIAGALLLTLAPHAGAAGEGCHVSRDPNAVSANGYYYVKEKVSDGQIYVVMYAETNGLAGLQTSYTSCGYGKPMIQPDREVQRVSQTYGG